MNAASKFILVLLLCLAHSGLAQNGYDREALQQLTQYRQVHRKTVDGRLCAAAFVQDDQTYTDCTTAKAPDGSTGEEWCYVEVQLLGKGGRDWNYCQSLINYDTLREKARDIFSLKTQEMGKTSNILTELASRLQNTLSRYDKACVIPSPVGNRITQAENTLRMLNHQIGNIQSSASRYHITVDTTSQLLDDIKRDMEESIRAEANCVAVVGYEDDPTEDGLRGSYYGNPYFQGPPAAYRDDSIINFHWERESPVDNVSQSQFSVRWDGWLLAPTTSEYTFIVAASCGSRLFLDESPIIVDRMPRPTSDEPLTEKSIRVLPLSDSPGVVLTESEPLRLKGGQKYRIRLEFFQLSSLRWQSPETATVKLMWKTNVEDVKVIDSKYLFRSNPRTPLKLSSLDPSVYDVSLLENGAQAFVDSTAHYVADVPARFEGKKMLTTLQRPEAETLSFNINVDSYVYASFPQSEYMPFTGAASDGTAVDFANTGDNLSVYHSYSPDVKATEAMLMAIHSAAVPAGDINLNVTKGVPFVLFFDQMKESIHQCNGEPIVVSQTDGDYLESCQASSEIPAQGCQAGLSGKSADAPYSSWHTSTGNGIGQFLTANFKSPIEITAFQYRPRDDPVTVPTVIELQFGGRKETEKIRVGQGHNTYELHRSVVTTKVTAVIVSMKEGSRSADTGGSIAFIGIPCAQVESSKVAEPWKKISISFKGSSMGFPPKGYLLDDGSIKSDHSGLNYGWEQEAVAVERRHCEESTAENTEGGITFKPRQSSECNEPQCGMNSWSVDLPHFGVYRVTIKVGSVCEREPKKEKRPSCIQVNNIAFIDGEVLKAGQFAEATGYVDCWAKNSITLTGNCSAKDAETIVDSIIIEKLPLEMESTNVVTS